MVVVCVRACVSARVFVVVVVFFCFVYAIVLSRVLYFMIKTCCISHY